MSKVKNILFRMKLNGNGIVNYDSNEQKWVYNSLPTEKLNHMKTRHENVSYAKKRFFGSGDDINSKIVISSDCLRHNIFIKESQTQSPNLIHNESLLYSFIASPSSLLRGYLFAKEETLKRSGALSICDALQSNDSVSTLETFSRSGAKNTDTEKEGSDNSFYKKEVIGDITYETNGVVDLMQLQFVSCDQIFDRYAFNPDLFPFYKQLMATKIPNFNSELGYHQQIWSDVKIPEYGFMLSNDNVVFMVKELFKKLLTLDIHKKNAFANVVSLEYKLVYNPIEDTMYNEENWIPVSNQSDIEAIDFEMENFYQLEDTEASNKLRQSLIDNYESIKAGKKAKKAEAAKNKKTKKTDETDENVE